MEKLKETGIIVKILRILYEDPKIKRIARIIEVNELAKHLNVILIKKSKEFILNIATNISNKKY